MSAGADSYLKLQLQNGTRLQGNENARNIIDWNCLLEPTNSDGLSSPTSSQRSSPSSSTEYSSDHTTIPVPSNKFIHRDDSNSRQSVPTSTDLSKKYASHGYETDDHRTSKKCRTSSCSSSDLRNSIGQSLIDILTNSVLDTGFSRFEKSSSMLFSQKDLEVYSKLAESVSFVHYKDTAGRPLLHYAIVYGNEQLFYFLLNHGSDIKARNKLSRVLCKGLYDQTIFFEYLQEYEGNSALHVACMQKEPFRWIPGLIRADNEIGLDDLNDRCQTPLHVLLCNPQMIDVGETVICINILLGRPSKFTSTNDPTTYKTVDQPNHLRHKEKMTKILTTRDTDDNLTPLSCLKFFLFRRKYNLAYYAALHLLKAGACPNSDDKYGRTLLSYSISHLDESFPLSRLLVNYGAVVYATNLLYLPLENEHTLKSNENQYEFNKKAKIEKLSQSNKFHYNQLASKSQKSTCTSGGPLKEKNFESALLYMPSVKYLLRKGHHLLGTNEKLFSSRSFYPVDFSVSDGCKEQIVFGEYPLWKKMAHTSNVAQRLRKHNTSYNQGYDRRNHTPKNTSIPYEHCQNTSSSSMQINSSILYKKSQRIVTPFILYREHCPSCHTLDPLTPKSQYKPLRFPKAPSSRFRLPSFSDPWSGNHVMGDRNEDEKYFESEEYSVSENKPVNASSVYDTSALVDDYQTRYPIMNRALRRRTSSPLCFFRPPPVFSNIDSSNVNHAIDRNVLDANKNELFAVGLRSFRGLDNSLSAYQHQSNLSYTEDYNAYNCDECFEYIGEDDTGIPQCAVNVEDDNELDNSDDLDVATNFASPIFLHEDEINTDDENDEDDDHPVSNPQNIPTTDCLNNFQNRDLHQRLSYANDITPKSILISYDLHDNASYISKNLISRTSTTQATRYKRKLPPNGAFENFRALPTLSKQANPIQNSYCNTTQNFRSIRIDDDQNCFDWYLRVVISRRTLEGSTLTLALLARVMGAEPSRMRASVIRSMFNHLQCFRVLGPLFLKIKILMAPYWNQPRSLKYLASVKVRHLLVSDLPTNATKTAEAFSTSLPKNLSATGVDMIQTSASDEHKSPFYIDPCYLRLENGIKLPLPLLNYLLMSDIDDDEHRNLEFS